VGEISDFAYVDVALLHWMCPNLLTYKITYRFVVNTLTESLEWFFL